MARRALQRIPGDAAKARIARFGDCGRRLDALGRRRPQRLQPARFDVTARGGDEGDHAIGRPAVVSVRAVIWPKSLIGSSSGFRSASGAMVKVTVVPSSSVRPSGGAHATWRAAMVGGGAGPMIHHEGAAQALRERPRSGRAPPHPRCRRAHGGARMAVVADCAMAGLIKGVVSNGAASSPRRVKEMTLLLPGLGPRLALGRARRKHRRMLRYPDTSTKNSASRLT